MERGSPGPIGVAADLLPVFRCHAFVMDAADERAPVPFPEGTLDVIVLIFVLSALPPAR